MKRKPEHAVVIESMRAALPKKFTLTGQFVRHKNEYRGQVWAIPPKGYELDDDSESLSLGWSGRRGQVLAVIIAIAGMEVRLKLAKFRKPRTHNLSITRRLVIDLSDPQSLEKIEKWTSHLDEINLPWLN